MRRLLASGFVVAMAIAACALPLPAAPRHALDPAVPIECGPVTERDLCVIAAEVAAAARANSPPVADVTMRLPRPDDDCVGWQPPCGVGTLIVVIQSGDTLQEIPLVRAGDGWAPLNPPRR